MKALRFDFETGEIIEEELEIEEVDTNLGARLAIRAERDMRLRDSDRFMISDFPIAPGKRQEWVAYRQALRDLPSTVDPLNPVWPKRPDA